jgi:ABC-type sulfate transport system permease component
MSAEELTAAAAVTLVLGLAMTVGVIVGVFGILLGWLFGRRRP